MKKIIILFNLVAVSLSLYGCQNLTTKNTTTTTKIVTTQNNTTKDTTSTNKVTTTTTTQQTTTTTTTRPTTTTTTTRPTTTTTTQEEDFGFEFEGYYVTLKDVSEEDLKQELKELVSKKKTLSYKDMWTTCKEANKDPNNSSNVIIFYSGMSVKASDQNTGGSTGWNREHVFPLSYGSNKTDAHHVMPESTTTNSIRGNLPFAELPNGSFANSNWGMTTSKCDGSYFEPRDEVKGDVARIIMYMSLVYDLNPSRIFKDESLMLKWHLNDPVDDFELNRNNVIENYQDNRNPLARC